MVESLDIRSFSCRTWAAFTTAAASSADGIQSFTQTDVDLLDPAEGNIRNKMTIVIYKTCLPGWWEPKQFVAKADIQEKYYEPC